MCLRKVMANKPIMSHNGTATKNDVVQNLYNEIGYSKKYSADLVESCFDVIKQKLLSGSNVKISGFGHFVLREKNARLGHDPTTGDKITIPARRVITFKISSSLRKKVQ